MKPEIIIRTDAIEVARIAVDGGWLWIASTHAGGVAMQFVRDHKRDWLWRDRHESDTEDA